MNHCSHTYESIREKLHSIWALWQPECNRGTVVIVDRVMQFRAREKIEPDSVKLFLPAVGADSLLSNHLDFFGDFLRIHVNAHELSFLDGVVEFPEFFPVEILLVHSDEIVELASDCLNVVETV